MFKPETWKASRRSVPANRLATLGPNTRLGIWMPMIDPDSQALRGPSRLGPMQVLIHVEM